MRVIAKLTDPWFDARFVSGHADHDPNVLAGAGYLRFKCPHRFGRPGNSDDPDDPAHLIMVPFANPLGGWEATGLQANPAGWQMSGTSLADLTLTPSILHRGNPDHTECWHGYITNGEVLTC